MGQAGAAVPAAHGVRGIRGPQAVDDQTVFQLAYVLTFGDLVYEKKEPRVAVGIRNLLARGYGGAQGVLGHQELPQPVNLGKALVGKSDPCPAEGRRGGKNDRILVDFGGAGAPDAQQVVNKLV
jgi:hypothetical protein